MHIPTEAGPVSAEKITIPGLSRGSNPSPSPPRLTAGDICAKHFGKRIRFTVFLGATVEDELVHVDSSAAESEYVSTFVHLGLSNVRPAEGGRLFRVPSTTAVELIR